MRIVPIAFSTQAATITICRLSKLWSQHSGFVVRSDEKLTAFRPQADVTLMSRYFDARCHGLLQHRGDERVTASQPPDWLEGPVPFRFRPGFPKLDVQLSQ